MTIDRDSNVDLLATLVFLCVMRGTRLVAITDLFRSFSVSEPTVDGNCSARAINYRPPRVSWIRISYLGED